MRYQTFKLAGGKVGRNKTRKGQAFSEKRGFFEIIILAWIEKNGVLPLWTHSKNHSKGTRDYPALKNESLAKSVASCLWNHLMSSNRKVGI